MEPLQSAIAAIQSGDVAALTGLLLADPALATARVADPTGNGVSRTLLHVATDWPGHHPNVAASIGVLAAAGADVNARCTGAHAETPLHWAASSDDVEAIDALLYAGADIEAAGAVIGGGTPMTDATAFGQWNAARRLLERGARTTLWEAAALGLLDLIDVHLAATPEPTAQDVTRAFWGACHGNQRATAERLLAAGAEVDWVGWDEFTPLDAAMRSGATDLVTWLKARSARTAAEVRTTS